MMLDAMPIRGTVDEALLLELSPDDEASSSAAAAATAKAGEQSKLVAQQGGWVACCLGTTCGTAVASSGGCFGRSTSRWRW